MDLGVQVLFSVKCVFNELGISAAVFIDDVRVNVCDHGDLGVAGVSLDGFNVAPVQFEFVSDARVAEAVENNFGKVLLLYKFPEFFLMTASPTGMP